MAITLTEIQAILRLRDELTAQLRGAAGQIAGMGKEMERVGTQLKTVGTNMTLAFTVPLTAAAGAALKFSSDFETVMTRVGTLTDIGADHIGEMRSKVLDLAPTVGVGPKPLGEALLVVASTGLKGQIALDVLAAAARATAVGLGDTKDVARAMTAAITAYGKENLSAAEASNKLFAAVREGGAEASEFAGTLGRVVGIASQVGVSFDEVLASVATFTRLGVDADEAVTALRGTLSTILKPSSQARDQLNELGLSIDDLRKMVRDRGLMEALGELVRLTEGNEDALAAVIPNVRALAGVMSNAGAQHEAYAEVLGKVKGATTDLDDAFAVVKETLGFKWNAAWAKAQTVLIQFGDSIAPAFERVLDAMVPLLDKAAAFVRWFGELPAGVKTAVIALGGLLAAAGPLAFAIGSITSALGGLMGLAPLLVPALAALTGPIGLIVIAVAGLTAAVVHFRNTVNSAGRGSSLSVPFSDAAKSAAEMTEKARALEAAAPPLRAGMQIVIHGLEGVPPAARGAGRALALAGDDFADLREEIAELERHGYSSSVAMRIMAADLESVGTKDQGVEALRSRFDALTESIKRAANAVQSIDRIWPSDWEQISAALGGNVLPVTRTTVPGAAPLPAAPQGLPQVSAGFAAAVRDLTGAFATLGQIAGGALADITKGIGQGLGGVNLLLTAADGLKPRYDDFGREIKKSFGEVAAGAVSVFGAVVQIGQAVAALPGVAAASNWLSGGMHERVQRIVEDWRTAAAGLQGLADRLGADNLDELARKAAEAGVSIEALLTAFRSRDAAGFAAELDRVTTALDRQARASAGARAFGPSRAELQQMAQDAHDTFDYMLKDGGFTAEQLEKAFARFQETLAAAGNEAAQQWVDAREMSTEAFRTAEAGLKDLIAQRNSLVQSIAAEAPEEVMGVIEAQQRGQLKVLDEQIASKADEYARLARDTGQRMADEIVKALRAMRIDPLHVPVVLDGLQGLSGIGRPGFSVESPEEVVGVMEAEAQAALARTIAALGMAEGGMGRVDRPTLFIAGEAGPEEFAFSGANRTFGAGGADDGALLAALGRIHDELAMSRQMTPALVAAAVRDAVEQAR